MTVVLLVFGTSACTGPPEHPATTVVAPTVDSQHAGITTPHGDHSPHHGGMVLMKGELHYEVVLDPKGRHSVWFSDAVREDLPASVASKVEMTVLRPSASAETLTLSIDESGESWVASGKPVTGNDDVTVKLSFVVRGEPYEIEIPFLAQK
jgi:hypothetical protein